MAILGARPVRGFLPSLSLFPPVSLSLVFTFTFTCSCQNCGQCDDREEQACEKIASHTYNYDTVHGDLDEDHDGADDDENDVVQDDHNVHADCDDNYLLRHCSRSF